MPRKPKISREAVLNAALVLVDQEGVDALSMRRLGKALDVEAMSLYRYVPNKEAVLNGVYEAVLEEVEFPERSGDWVEDARALSVAMRNVLRKHPKTLPIFASRPAITEGSMRYFEQGMEILAESFPIPALRLCAFQSLFTFVIGHTLFQYETITSDLDVWSSEQLQADVFPMLVATKEDPDPFESEEEFHFALDALLLGFQQKCDLPLPH